MQKPKLVEPVRHLCLHLILIQSLTHFRIVFGLQFLKCNPVETIHPLVEARLCFDDLRPSVFGLAQACFSSQKF